MDGGTLGMFGRLLGRLLGGPFSLWVLLIGRWMGGKGVAAGEFASVGGVRVLLSQAGSLCCGRLVREGVTLGVSVQ